MGCNVFADGHEIACKAGGGKVIAAFPDVCLSPPSPPAGPIPVPYPNTSFSKDMKNGSKSVKIKNKPVMLKNKSFYKSSPLGDEPATKSLGAGVITHTITGKTYFNAWSMDVKFEGQNVDRNLDITTSNHASPIPNAGVPWNNISAAAMAKATSGVCPCCDGPVHSQGAPVDCKKWYDDRATIEGPRPHRPERKFKSPNKPNRPEQLALSVADKQQLSRDQIKKAEDRTGCTCSEPTEVLPKDPCNVCYASPQGPTAHTEQSDMTKAARAAFNPKGGGGIKDKFNQNRAAAGKAPCAEVMHLTPIAAGGCPGTPDGGNLQCKDDLCQVCKDIDDGWSSEGLQTINYPHTS